MTSPAKSGFRAQFAKDISGVHTEFVYHRFANKWFLIITQYGRMPNMYTVKFDVQEDQRIIPPAHNDDPEFHISVPITMQCNFGSDTDETRSGIQFLVNKTALNKCPTEFVISLGLKDVNGKNLREVAKVLEGILI